MNSKINYYSLHLPEWVDDCMDDLELEGMRKCVVISNNKHIYEIEFARHDSYLLYRRVENREMYLVKNKYYLYIENIKKYIKADNYYFFKYKYLQPKHGILLIKQHKQVWCSFLDLLCYVPMILYYIWDSIN